MLPKLNTLDPQKGKLGRAFRNIGLRQDLTKPPLYVKGEYKHHWVYLFKYLDDGSCFEIEIDYHGKFVSKKRL